MKNDWIEWVGGECPVKKGTLVDVTYRCGVSVTNIPAMLHDFDSYNGYTAYNWDDDGTPYDIVKYRIV